MHSLHAKFSNVEKGLCVPNVNTRRNKHMIILSVDYQATVSLMQMDEPLFLKWVSKKVKGLRLMVLNGYRTMVVVGRNQCWEKRIQYLMRN